MAVITPAGIGGYNNIGGIGTGLNMPQTTGLNGTAVTTGYTPFGIAASNPMIKAGPTSVGRQSQTSNGNGTWTNVSGQIVDANGFVIQPSTSATTATGSSLMSPYQLTAPIGGTNTGGSSSLVNSGPNGPFANLGPQLANSATTSMNAGNSILANEGMGQTALYDQTQNENQQATAQGIAASGLTGSPWGASVNAANNVNFNNDWNDKQLARNESALSAQEGSFGNANTLYDFNNSKVTQNIGQPNTAGGGSGTPASGGSGAGMASPSGQYGGTTSVVPTSPFQPVGTPISQTPGGPATDTSTALNQTGVNDQGMGLAGNMTPQQTQSPYQMANSLTGNDPNSQSYTDSQGTTNVGGTTMTADQLINPQTDPNQINGGQLMVQPPIDYTQPADPSQPQPPYDPSVDDPLYYLTGLYQ